MDISPDRTLFSEGFYRFLCPHCFSLIEVAVRGVRCGVFRCGVFQGSGKKRGRPIPPHLSREKCEELVRNNQIYGCAGPFRLIQTSPGEYAVEICEYI